MNGLNLIPSARVASRRRRSRVRIWAVALGLYACVLGLGAAGSWSAASRAAGETVDVRAGLEREVAGAQASLGPLRARLSRTLATIRAASAVTDHPDWSVLLTMLDALRADEVVLDALRLARDGSGPAQAGAEPSFTLEVSGFARSPQAVTRFVLRLEQAGVFRGVQLRETTESVLATDPPLPGVAFRLSCALAGTGGRP